MEPMCGRRISPLLPRSFQLSSPSWSKSLPLQGQSASGHEGASMSTVHVFLPAVQYRLAARTARTGVGAGDLHRVWPAAHPGGNRFRSRAPTEARGADGPQRVGSTLGHPAPLVVDGARISSAQRWSGAGHKPAVIGRQNERQGGSSMEEGIMMRPHRQHSLLDAHSGSNAHSGSSAHSALNAHSASGLRGDAPLRHAVSHTSSHANDMGTSGHDHLMGAASRDVMMGGRGADAIAGKAGQRSACWRIRERHAVGWLRQRQAERRRRR